MDKVAYRDECGLKLRFLLQMLTMLLSLVPRLKDLETFPSSGISAFEGRKDHSRERLGRTLYPTTAQWKSR